MTTIKNAINDNDIWEKFIGGDIPAFRHLMKAHYQTLFNYGIKIAGDEELVKDLIQELFIRLWHRRTHLSKAVNAKPYLVTSLRRDLNRRLRQPGINSFADAGYKRLPFDLEISVEQRFINRESNRLLACRMRQHIMQLPKRQKEVLYLKYMQELDRKEIADIMEISMQTVSNICQMALRNLKIEIEKQPGSLQKLLS